MKKTFSILALCGLSLSASLTTNATELASDDFSYSDGSLTSNPDWTNFSGTTGDLLVSSGEAIVEHGTPSEDGSIDFEDQTTGTIYYGIDFSVDDLGAPYSGTDAEYFAFFRYGHTEFTARMDISAPSGGGDYTVGIADSSTAEASWATDLVYGVSYRAVVAYDIDNDQAKLWINPTAEGDPSILGADGSNTRTIQDFALRQSDSSENETVRVDNLIVATTFEEALGTVTGETLTVTLSVMAVQEDAGTGQVDVTVERSGATTDVLDITLASNDPTEATIPVPARQIPAGQASETFTLAVDIVNDTLADGPQDVIISASAGGFASGSETLTVTDDGDPHTLVINEIYSIPDTTDGDANGDGEIGGADDEFIEIVNYGASAVDLTGFKLTDLKRDIHYFPAGTILESGCALVVFGGGSVFDGVTAEFGHAEIQKSSQGLLFLTNEGDTVSIVNGGGETVYTVVVPDLTDSTAEGSYNLDPDGTVPAGVPAYDRHATLAGVASNQYSPGTKVDGTAFCPAPAQALTLAVVPASVAENGGAGVATATVSIPASPGTDLTVHLETGDSSELVPQEFSGIITVGTTSVEILLDAVDDTSADGTQTVTLSTHAGGYLNGSTTVEVTDDGDVAAFTDLVINEVDANQPGTDTTDFIELFNLTGSAQALDGLVVVLINGNGDVVYNAIDLTGETIPADGYFVIGQAAVPGGVDIELGSSGLQNGTDAVALYEGSVDDFAGKTIGAFPATTPVDVIIYDDNGTPDAGLEAFFGIATLSDEGDGGEDDALARSADGTGAFVTMAPTPGVSNSTIPGDGGLEIVQVGFDFVNEFVVVFVSGLEAGKTYDLVNSVDLGAPWASIFAFTTTTPGVVDTGNGIYQVPAPDATLSPISTTAAQFYRVVEQTP